MKHWIAVLIITGMLAGCATAGPQLINGRYYMTGDAACARVKPNVSGDLMCYDKHDNFVGIRSPLSSDEMQMYQYGQQRNAELNRQAIQQQAQQPLPNYYPQYSAPQVQGIPTQPKATGYNQAGNTFIGTNGTVCSEAGNTVICR